MIEHQGSGAALELIIRDIEQLVGEMRVHQRVGVDEQVFGDYSAVIERDLDREHDCQPQHYQRGAGRVADQRMRGELDGEAIPVRASRRGDRRGGGQDSRRLSPDD